MKKLLSIVLLVCLGLSARAFDIRAVYVDHRTQVQTLPALKALAKKAAEGGMNALIMEWEATFPFEQNEVLCNEFAFSRDEVKDFISYCSGLGIDVIPLQNCFGHAEYILRHDRYASLREDSRDYSQVCPLKTEEAKKVFGSIFSEIAELHPSRYIHIGCDETRLLGKDKSCAAYVAQNGRSQLFVDYVVKMCQLVHGLGKTPVIWGDILLQNPEAASKLPKDVVIVDWNYGWNVNHFGDIDALLSQGFEMWGASSLRSSPDNIYLTQWDKHLANLREYIPFCRQKGFKGIIQTSWSTSGQYSYVWDHNSLIDLIPIREVYPAQAFDMLWQAFFLAVSDSNVLPEGFEEHYLSRHFALKETDAAALSVYFTVAQNPVTGKNFTAEKIRSELDNALQLQKTIRTVHPRQNRKDFAHLVLMLDLRINYLRFKAVQFSYENCQASRKTTAKELKRLCRESSRLVKRFVRHNRKNLKSPARPLGDQSYVGQMKRLYDICK